MANNSAPEGSLPFGWQTQVSRRYPNRVYYFNVSTGCTTWECPALDFSKKNRQGKQEKLQSDTKGTKRQRESPPRNTLALLKQASNKLATVQENSKQKVSSSQSISEDCSSKPNPPPTAIVTPVVQNFSKKGKVRHSPVSPPNTRSIAVSRQKAKKNKLKTSQAVRRSTPKVPSNLQTHEAKNSRIKKKQIGAVDSAKGIEHNQAVASSSKSKDDGDDDDDDKDTEDIEMFDVSMECMDELALKNDTVFDPLAKYYIVVDTNVLISKLNLIDELKDTPLDGCGPPHIFIPWVVIEELDRLKSSRAAKNIMRAACEAIRYLNSVLSKHPRFHGQSPSEAEAWAKSYSKVNDDKILECCMALGDKMSKEKVILLTNDKNLVNKALICGINVHDWMSMMEKVKPDVVFNGAKRKRDSFDKESQNVSVAGDVSKATGSFSKEQGAMQSKRDHCKREIHTLMSTGRQSLKDVLTDFVKEEMQEAYGNVWQNFPVKLEFLGGLFEVIQKYWKMVFSEIFNEKDKRNIELLHEKVRRPEGFLGDKEECLIILSAIEDIFRQIKRRSPKNKAISLVNIQKLRVRCIEIFTKSSEIEKTIRDVEDHDVHAVFEQNWGIMNQLCGLVMDFSNVSHDFQYEKPEQLPSEMDFRLLMCNFYPALQQMKNHMTNMVDLVSKNKPSRQSFKKLANSLLQFIPSLKIPACEVVSHHHFSQKALERFCTNPQNRELIEIGCKQIEKFYAKLDEALNSMMKSNFNTSASPENMLLD